MFDSFSRLKKTKVVVFGDLMLDRYTEGKASRVSPEAPVLVLQGNVSEDLPGGAGNVALNLVSLGATVEVVGRVGKDAEGKQLVALLKQEGVGASHVVTQKEYPTTLKHRVIADAHHLLRIDRESIEALDLDVEEKLQNELPALIKGADAVAISDYGKGFLSRAFLKNIIKVAKKHSVPVFVDPKGDDFTKYQEATLIKPNEKEAFEAAKRSRSVSIEQVGAILLEQTRADHLLITRSEKGMSLFATDEAASHFPIKAQKVSDVTGAGDAVLAMMIVGMSSDLHIEETIPLANLAGCIAVSSLGCTRVTLGDVAEKMLQEHQQSKVFETSHSYALQEALKEKPVHVLALEPEQTMGVELFAALQEMEQKEGYFVLYARDRIKRDPLLTVLSRFDSIDFIILSKQGLEVIEEKPVYTVAGKGITQTSWESLSAPLAPLQ